MVAAAAGPRQQPGCSAVGTGHAVEAAGKANGCWPWCWEDEGAGRWPPSGMWFVCWQGRGRHRAAAALGVCKTVLLFAGYGVRAACKGRGWEGGVCSRHEVAAGTVSWCSATCGQPQFVLPGSHLLIMRVVSQLLQLSERLTSGQQQLNQTGDVGGMAA